VLLVSRQKLEVEVGKRNRATVHLAPEERHHGMPAPWAIAGLHR
jgi:hypothetical protein